MSDKFSLETSDGKRFFDYRLSSNKRPFWTEQICIEYDVIIPSF